MKSFGLVSIVVMIGIAASVSHVRYGPPIIVA